MNSFFIHHPSAFILTLAHVAQLVEHVLGKDEVVGSIPIVSSESAKIYAGVTQLVESQPSKLLVASSSLVSRSESLSVAAGFSLRKGAVRGFAG